MAIDKKLLITGLIFLFLFGFFSYLLHLKLFVAFDFDNTVRLQDHLPRIVDAPFSYLSLVGSLESASIVLFILWAIYRKMNYIFVIGAYGLFHLVELFGKAFVNHPPPPFMFFRYNLGVFFPSSYVQPGSSYPSGHAGRAAFLSVVIISLIWNSKYKNHTKIALISFILVFDLAMFVSRVYLGEHWTSDVIGGTMLGIALGSLSSSTLTITKPKAKN